MREFARFEVAYQLKRRSTWILLGLFLFPLVGVTSDRAAAAAGSPVPYHAPLAVAQHGVLMTLIALLVIAAVAGDAATRDTRTRLEPLFHAAPVSPAAYLGGRFLGAFGVAALLLTVVPLVHGLVPLLQSDPSGRGAFSALAYGQAYFLLVVPNAFVATALLFAAATLVRHTVGSYLAVAFVFVLGQTSDSVIGELLGRWDLAKLADSTGIVALDVMSRTWSPTDLAGRLVTSDALLLWNRILWLAIAASVLAVTARRFDFERGVGDIRWWQRGPLRARARRVGVTDDSVGVVDAGAMVPVPPSAREFTVMGRVRQFVAATRDSLREMPGWLWLALPLAIWLKIVINMGALRSRGAGTAVLPATERILEPLGDVAPPIVLAIFLFPVIIAGELVWRERDANLHALADAAPVPDGIRYGGKLAGLWLVLVAMFGAGMVADVLTQLWMGPGHVDLPLYLQIAGITLVDALMYALLALSVQVVVNHKAVGVVVVLLLIAGRNFLASFGIDHPLLVYASGPSWYYSAISGVGPFLGPVGWFQLYWVEWTVLFALVAGLFWIRGIEGGTRERLRVARRRFRGRLVAAFAATATLIALTGGFVFYNTNILNVYQPAGEASRRLAEYERKYGSYRDTPQPSLSATELNVELYPERRAADLRGTHTLVNRTAQPIETIHVAVSLDVETGEVDFGRPARVAIMDDRLGHRTYVLGEPLQPGDSLPMSWQVRHQPRGFPARGISTAVVENGTFIEVPRWTPLIGYQPWRELDDPGDRQQQGLPPRAAIPSLDDSLATHSLRGHEGVALDITIGTAPDQVAVAPGVLRDEETRNGRRYFHYATTAPVGNEYAIFSARYAVREERLGDVVLQVVYHPGHAFNVDRMMRSMVASVRQLSARFGAYRYPVLRMVEYPSRGGSLHAAPGAIWYQELFALSDPGHERRRIDMPFAVTAHEVAHQFQPRSASVEGRALLSESFAWYAALGVIEEAYGADGLARFLSFMRESYRSPRSRADVPLLRASDFFLAYRKGPFAMYALREYVGQHSVDLAWRRLIEQHESGEPPLATSLDLYREFQQVTPDSLQYLLGDLLERNTFWELETRQATAQPNADGTWQVTIDLTARKVAVDTAGAETEMPMDDLVEVGVYAAPATDEARGDPLYVGRHRIGTGPQTITVTVSRQPAQAGIDPRHLLIDVTPSDNLADVLVPSTAQR